MHRKLIRILWGVLLVGALMVFTLATPYVSAAPASITGCRADDYACGYLHGFADGRTAARDGLCARPHFYSATEPTPSERGYRDAFEHYCPA